MMVACVRETAVGMERSGSIRKILVGMTGSEDGVRDDF